MCIRDSFNTPYPGPNGIGGVTVDGNSSDMKMKDVYKRQILVIDIPSNQVVAYCWNVHFDRKQGGNQVDVIQAPRSTGSILKPFLYYAMLQEGSMLPDMLLPDVPVNINGYTPQNFSMQ